MRLLTTAYLILVDAHYRGLGHGATEEVLAHHLPSSRCQPPPQLLPIHDLSDAPQDDQAPQRQDESRP